MAKIPIQNIGELTNTNPVIKDALWYDSLVDASIHREWVANVGNKVMLVALTAPFNAFD